MATPKTGTKKPATKKPAKKAAPKKAPAKKPAAKAANRVSYPQTGPGRPRQMPDAVGASS